MKKKVSRFAILLSAFLVFAFPSFAEEVTDVYLSLQIDNPVMTVNGMEVEVDEGRGTAPLIVEGRTLLPIRAVIEAFGGEVLWDAETESINLSMGKDEISLGINRREAYLNGKEQLMDVAPIIINGRTMLPIRFVAESFGLGVAWDESDRTVHIVRDVLTEAEYEIISAFIPDYNGEPWVTVNGNVPFFKDYEIINAPFEYYSPLDELSRCGVVVASVDEDVMPDEGRKSISSVKPTGWLNKEYDFISGKSLYNRCHLIGFQLTGENANARNLITGTRYMNVDGMLPFEDAVDDFVDNDECRVMYRVTPVFSGDNLVAHGVLIEALTINCVNENSKSGESFSEEENTEVYTEEMDPVSFCVFCYNVQPGIIIDYKTGENRVAEDGEDIFLLFESFGAEDIAGKETITETGKVYRTPSGKKYHFDLECGGKNSFEVTIEEAENDGLTPCSKCAN